MNHIYAPALERSPMLDEVSSVLALAKVDLSTVAVAGGFAASPGRAGDMDVWLLGIDIADKNYWSTRHRVLDARNVHCAWKAFPNGKYPEELERDYALSDSHFSLITTFQSRTGQIPIQIIATCCKTLPELLDRFDLSTHACGFMLDKPRDLITSPRWTPLTAVPRMLHGDSPEQTGKRLLKLCERYGHQPHPSDVFMLALTQ